MTNIPADLAALCDAVRVALGWAHAEGQMQELRPALDDSVATLAHIHRVAALIHYTSSTADTYHTRDPLAALTQSGDLIRLSREFRARGIPLLSYKGPILAQLAYGSPLLRVCSDLDLLVHPEDVDAALATLHDCGYRDVYEFTSAEDAWFRSVDGDYPLVHQDTGAVVELHCRVSSRRFGYELETKELWARRQHVELGGCAIDTLGVDDTLIVLAVHGAKHRWGRLEWVAAFAAMLERADPASVERMVVRANEIGGRRAVLLAARLASTLLGAPRSLALAAALTSDRGIEGLVGDAIAAMVLAGDSGSAGRSATFANMLFNFRILDGPLDRARYCVRWLFLPSPEDWRTLHLPSRWFRMYMILRPARLLLVYARAGWLEYR